MKGKNRHVFENRLVSNIRDCLKKNSIDADVKKVRGRIFVFTNNKKALECLKKVFGLVSISSAEMTESLPKAIEKKSIDYVKEVLKTQKPETFRISTKRTDKNFPKTSQEMDIMLGDAVGDKFSLKARMKDPDLDIGVEIHDRTFIFHEKLSCFGGLPIGVSGKVACLIEDERSLAAAWLMMKRGCMVLPIGRKKEDIDLLKKYSYGCDIRFTQITDLSEIDGFAAENDCQAIITGDTIEEFEPERYKDTNLTILSPLIAYNEKMLSDLLVRIR